MSTNKIIYKTSPGITPIVLRVLLSLPIALCIFNFKLNPEGFSIIISIFLIFIIFLPSTIIIVKENHFMITISYFFGLISKSYTFNYIDLEKVVFHDDKIEMDKTFIPVFPYLSGKFLEVIYNDKDQKREFKNVHLKWKQVKHCMDLINEKIDS